MENNQTINNKLENDVLFHLRNVIKEIDQKPLPKSLTVDNVIRGECKIPPTLFDFMQNLIRELDISDKDSNGTIIKVTSICTFKG